MCKTSCKKTQKCVTHQQRMGEQSCISAWPNGSVLRCSCHSVTIAAFAIRMISVDSSVFLTGYRAMKHKWHHRSLCSNNVWSVIHSSTLKKDCLSPFIVSRCLSRNFQVYGMSIQWNCDIVASFKYYSVWKLQLQLGIVKFSFWNLSGLYMSFERICEELLQYKDCNFARILILFIKTHRSNHVVLVLTA